MNSELKDLEFQLSCITNLFSNGITSNVSVKPGFGNLSIKNRLRDRFSGSKSRQVT